MTSLASIVQNLCKNRCGEKRTETPRFELFDAAYPFQAFNLEKYYGWNVTNTSGLFDLAERDFVESRSPYRDGVSNQATRLKEREISFRVEICNCNRCDEAVARRELYDGVRCASCTGRDCTDITCLSGTNCTLPVSTGCILRVRCCGVELMTHVRLKSASRSRRAGRTCEVYDIVFQQDDPRWFSKLQRVVIRPNEDNTSLQSCFTSVWTCNPQRLNTCITVPYAGDTVAFPRIYLAGHMVNPTITNSATGAQITLDRDGVYLLPSCRSATLTFWRGDQLYEDVLGNNLYPLLGTSCRKFSFEPCPEGIEICVSAEQVSDDAVIMIEWFDYYESIVAAAPSVTAGASC